MLAKLITLVESSNEQHRSEAGALISRLTEDRTRNDVKPSLRIGISGAPGVGKSTFIEAFGLYLISKGFKVAVLAVDPSSTRTGGSILGDKTRMFHLATDSEAYVRPSPSRGTLGGVGRNTSEAILLCEEAGYDIAIVETVGVGQSETAVENLVDMFILLVAPGGGDELQGLKKGVVELADLILVNKSDGELAQPASQTRYDYLAAVRLLTPKWEGWRPPVLKCSAVTQQDIWETISRYFTQLKKTGELARKRQRQSEAWMWRMIHEHLDTEFRANPRIRQNLSSILSQLNSQTITPYQASQKLIQFAKPIPATE